MGRRPREAPRSTHAQHPRRMRLSWTRADRRRLYSSGWVTQVRGGNLGRTPVSFKQVRLASQATPTDKEPSPGIPTLSPGPGGGRVTFSRREWPRLLACSAWARLPPVSRHDRYRRRPHRSPSGFSLGARYSGRGSRPAIRVRRRATSPPWWGMRTVMTPPPPTSRAMPPRRSSTARPRWSPMHGRVRRAVNVTARRSTPPTAPRAIRRASAPRAASGRPGASVRTPARAPRAPVATAKAATAPSTPHRRNRWRCSRCRRSRSSPLRASESIPRPRSRHAGCRPLERPPRA